MSNIEIKIETKKEMILRKISKTAIFVLIFLFPLFFGNLGLIDFNKQALLIYLGFLALIFYFLGEILAGKVEFRFSILQLLGFCFILATAGSTIFSRWQWGSLWGWPLDTSANLLTIICFFLVFILTSWVFEKKDIFISQLLLIFGGSLAALIGILQLSGNFIFPLDFTKISSFNTIGTVNSWGIYLGALMPLTISLIFIAEKTIRPIMVILGIFLLGGLIVSNFWVAWLGVLVGASTILVFGLWKLGSASPKFLIAPMVLFSLALIFGLLKAPLPSIFNVPLEVSPTVPATLNVSQEMLNISLKDQILGWGLGTFKYGWSKFKSPDLNQTIFWNIRFSKGGSEILESLGTIGLLGTAFYILLIFSTIFIGTRELLRLQKEKKSLEWGLLLASLGGFASLSLVKFLYASNFSLGFLWWLFLGQIGALSVQKVKSFNLASDPKASFLFSFLAILVLVSGIFLFYLEGMRYFAEIKHNQALQEVQNFESSTALLFQAIRANSQQEIFWQNLAQIYLARAGQDSVRTDLSQEEATRRVSDSVANAVAASRRAAEINPENVTNWQIRGAVYREIIPFAREAADWALSSYEKALELEPNNPFILVELGRVYLIKADVVSGEERAATLEKAREYSLRAVDLKPDYAQAFYQMALISEAQGKRKEAISTLEAIKQIAGFAGAYDPLRDVGLAFQLGVLYYLDEQHDKAKTEFERAVSLSPTYSNARYFLGLIYDKNGQKGKAIEQFEEIKKLNPENEMVINILKNLREGKPALEGIASTGEVIPIETVPEEKR